MLGIVRSGYTLKLKNFEGPMELLLELIKDAKLEITDISLSNITDQYLLYLRTIQLFSIEVASEFFVIAATLVYMKTRRLLPTADDGEEEILDEKELVERLKEYRKFKYIAKMLLQMKEQGDIYFSRGPVSNPMGGQKQQNFDQILLGDLLAVLRRYKGAFIKKAIPIKRREVSVEAKMNFIMGILGSKATVKFSEVIKDDKNKVERVASFLGSLELSFRQRVLLRQLKLFMDIDIIRREGGVATAT